MHLCGIVQYCCVSPNKLIKPHANLMFSDFFFPQKNKIKKTKNQQFFGSGNFKELELWVT